VDFETVLYGTSSSYRLMTAQVTRVRSAAIALLFGVVSLHAQVSLLTYHNDLSRTGQNLTETILTPSNVQAGKFGVLFSDPVDGQVYGQPLYLWGLSIPAKGIHNVVFAVTEHDSVYAFDADSNTGPNAAPLWHVSFINPAAGVTAVPAENLVCQVIVPEIGITGTPVIDPDSETLYVVAMTLEDFGQTYVQRLHALDVTTGAERPGSPVEIEASVPGTGDGNTTVRFKPWLYKERAGLLLLNGVVYTAWSSHCDSGGYHGWVIGYDAKTLHRVAVYTSTPNLDWGSVWQGGAAPSADAEGNIYVVTGNGTFDADTGGSDLSDSVIKLSIANGFSVADYFTPFNADLLGLKDLDLGSSGALLLPDSAGTPEHPHLLVTGGKEGRIYVLDRESLGHFQPGADSQIVQSLSAAVGRLFGIPAYFNNTVYFSAAKDAVKAFPIANGLLSEKAASQSAGPFPYLGSVPSISANGSMDGIVWTIAPDGLHAYEAANLANELYIGSPGSYVKFSTPTIANGKVYVGTANSLVVFGLLTSPGIGTIVNSGGYQTGGVAPGSLVTVFGWNLAAGTQAASGNPLPEVLADSRLMINGLAAPLLFASPSQINAQVPNKTSIGTAAVVAMRGASASTPVGLKIQLAAPGIFAVLLNQDGTVNGPNQAAAPGSTLQAFLTGWGSSDLSVEARVAGASQPPVNGAVTLRATIGSQTATLLSAGLAPGLVGVFEVNVRVPEQPPREYPLVIEAGGVPSNSVPVSVGP
jgi:uncharacterized protein (TIGR03437 family)